MRAAPRKPTPPPREPTLTARRVAPRAPGLPCCIHGDGSNSRHFIYVGDVARAFITILHKGIDGETYNIGCETEYTNLEVAEKLVRALKPNISDPKEHIEFVADRPFNDVRCEKLRSPS